MPNIEIKTSWKPGYRDKLQRCKLSNGVFTMHSFEDIFLCIIIQQNSIMTLMALTLRSSIRERKFTSYIRFAMTAKLLLKISA